MTITVDPIIVPPSKIISISPSLVAVSVDDTVSVPDDEAEFKKLFKSSDEDLDEVIRLESLCSVMIPKTFLSAGISTADNVANNPVHHKTIVAESKSKIYCLNKVDATFFYDDSPWAQMNDGTSVSVTNLISLLHNVKFFNAKFKSNVYMHDTTSKLIIILRAVEYIRVHALTRQGFIDVKCYYLSHFSITLLSQVNVIEATGHPRQYISQGMQLSFALNEVIFD